MKKKNLLKRIFHSYIFRVFLIICFAVAMAYLEAVLVVYLREILAISYPDEMPQTEVALSVPYVPYFVLLKNPLSVIPNSKILTIEIFREAATIIMLFSFAWLIGKKIQEKLAVFLLSFGLWDIFYYVFLYILLGWPASLSTIDVLFLIPLPWVAPVWVPILASALMISASSFILIKTARAKRQKS